MCRESMLDNMSGMGPVSNVSVPPRSVNLIVARVQFLRFSKKMQRYTETCQKSFHVLLYSPLFCPVFA